MTELERIKEHMKQMEETRNKFLEDQYKEGKLSLFEYISITEQNTITKELRRIYDRLAQLELNLRYRGPGI